MQTLIALYLWGLSLWVLWKMLRDFQRRTHDLLSLRNFFLLGYVIFQLHSAAGSLVSDEYGKFPVTFPAYSGFIFAIWSTIFLFVFLYTYDRGWLSVRMADRLPRTSVAPGALSLLALAVLMTLLAVILRFTVTIPYIGIVAVNVGIGASAVACGLVGWVWVRQLFNPFLMAYGGAIVMANLVNVVTGAFGRRSLIAVLGAVLWGMYYSRWRYMTVGPMLRRFAILAIIPVLVVALFSSVRSPRERGRTAGEHLQAITQGGNIATGLAALSSGQATGAGAMWALESYPERFAHRHLMTVWYFIVYPVPRAWWPDKPWPLSILTAELAMMSGMPRGVFTAPPGIVGNAAAEGGFYALIIYAVLGGMFVRFFDQLIFNSALSPFVVLPIGSALGQALGLARGETSAFAHIMVQTVVLMWLAMLLAAKFLEATGWAGAAQEWRAVEVPEYEPQADHPAAAQAAVGAGQ